MSVNENPIIEAAEEPEIPETSAIERMRESLKFSFYHATYTKPEDLKRIRSVLEESSCSFEVKLFAIEHLASTFVDDRYLQRLREKIDFIDKEVPIELLKSADQEFIRLMCTPDASYLSAMKKILGERQWLEILGNEVECKNYREAYDFGPLSGLPKEEFLELSQRDGIEVEADEEIKNFINLSGVGDIAKHFAKKITLVEHGDRTEKFMGRYYRRDGSLIMSSTPEYKSFLILAMLHETGHGVEFRVATDDVAKEIYDEYVVLSQVEPTKNSPYAKAFKMAFGKTDNTRIRESFAEDFRLYWLKPEDLSPGKRSVFDRLCERFLSGVDVKEAREKISGALKDTYDTDFEEIFRKYNNDMDVVKKAEELKIEREKGLKEFLGKAS